MKSFGKLWLAPLAVAGLGIAVWAAAFDAPEPDVLVAQNATYGKYLTNVKGNTLYVYLKDSPNTSTCVDNCAKNWPPHPYNDKDKPLAGAGADVNLVGFIKRTDMASPQVTYKGWPLYTYIKDEKAGDVNGQGLGGNWYLVAPNGEPIKQAGQAAQGGQAAQAPATNPAFDKAVAEGSKVYDVYCAGCHGGKGEGGVGTKLVGLASLKDFRGISSQILGGGGQMPGFGSSLDDQQVADVMTFIRNSWGNSYGLTTPAEIKARR